MGRGFSIIAFLCVPLASSVGSAAASPLFDIIPIRAPAGSGAYSVVGFDINNRGEVVGEYSQEVPNRIGGFFYSDTGGTVDFSVAGKRSTSATGINDAGQISISTSEANAHWRVMYRHAPGTGLQELPTLGGDESETRGVNASGQITGYSQAPDGFERAFRYTENSGIQNLSGVAGGTGFAINDQGWVAGTRGGQATLFRDEGNIDLGPGRARGLNNSGDVVGKTFIVPGHPTAFVYRSGEMMILADDVFADAILFDINEAGQAVGNGFVGNSDRALFWSDATGLVELNTLLPENSGWQLFTANAINDFGQITGQGIYNGEIMAFRADPIPEPSTWALMVLGAMGLYFTYRRRKK